jgi:hypothetical protein
VKITNLKYLFADTGYFDKILNWRNIQMLKNKANYFYFDRLSFSEIFQLFYPKPKREKAEKSTSSRLGLRVKTG